MTEDENWLGRIWEYREEVLYPQLFGELGADIFPLSGEIFTELFEQDSVDPRWLSHGVFESPPCDAHESWIYVTSGLSNAWEDEKPEPDGPSGLGCEIFLETNQPGEWAIERVQQVMAFQILLAHDRYPGRGLLSCGDRIPLRSSLTPEPSDLTSLLIVEPSEHVSEFQLESGSVNLLALLGITETEAQFARDTTSQELLERLAAGGHTALTDPKRKCTLSE